MANEKLYTAEQIKQGFEMWNNYVRNGGEICDYDAETADSEQQAQILIDFIEEQ